jgi:hypothetical protein
MFLLFVCRKQRLGYIHAYDILRDVVLDSFFVIFEPIQSLPPSFDVRFYGEPGVALGPKRGTNKLNE